MTTGQKPLAYRTPVGTGLVTLALVLSGCVDGSAPTQRVEQTDFNVNGTVRSKVDGLPIEGVTVSFWQDAVGACVPLVASRREPTVRFAAAPLRIGPICFPVGTAQTSSDGRYEIAASVEYEPNQCLRGLYLSALAAAHRRAEKAGLTCTSDPQTIDFELDPASVAPPELLVPAPGYAVPQNQTQTGCVPSAIAGSGYAVRFDWSDADGTTSAPTYRIVVEREDAALALVDQSVGASELVLVRCAFVMDSNLNGWHWRVRVETPEEISEWSEARPFRFEPCRLGDGSPCRAS